MIEDVINKKTPKYFINRRDLMVIVLLFATIISLWVLFRPYQSHALSGLRILGDTTTENYIGVPKEGRGDEWSTYLPLLKQAALEGFPDQSSLEPYKEKFNWFIGIPKADASLFFLPNHIVYFFLSDGLALSFQGIYYNLLLVFSLFFLLRNINVDAGIAIFSAIGFLFTQFYQVWWTSNFPALAASVLPFVILTSRLEYRWKFLLSFWAVGHLLFGQIYPPFYLSLFFCLTPILFFIKPDTFKFRDLISIGIGALFALFLFFVYKYDYIQLVSHTEYPGHRFETGGGSTWQALLNLIFPTWFIQSAGHIEPVYELSVAATLLPVILISMLPVIRWSPKTIWVTLGFLIVLAFSINYAINGIPAGLAKYTGLSLVPGRRMHFGISFAVLIYSSWIISENKNKFSVWMLIPILCIPLFLTDQNNHYKLISDNFKFSKFYYQIFLIFAVLLIGCGYLKAAWLRGGYVKLIAFLGCMAIVHAAVFGSFNPIMNANAILRPVESQLIRDWKALYQANDMKSFAVLGNFGHLLRGEGLPALEAIHMVNVENSVYDSIFPEISSEQRISLFNRFIGISFDNIDNVDLDRGLTKFFPMYRHSIDLKHDFSSAVSVDMGSIGNVSAQAVETAIPDVWKVFFKGVMSKDLELSEVIHFTLKCSVEDSWVSRFPIPGIERESKKISLRGVLGFVEVRGANKDDVLKCVKEIQLVKDF